MEVRITMCLQKYNGYNGCQQISKPHDVASALMQKLRSTLCLSNTDSEMSNEICKYVKWLCKVHALL